MELLKRILKLLKSTLPAKALPVSPRAVSADPGLALVKHYEGCRLKPYLCAGGKPTIGWGNTYYENGTKVTLADKPITQARADALFKHWYDLRCRELDAILPTGTTPEERAAFISFSYNFTVETLKGAGFYRAFLAGDKARAGARLEEWNMASGKVSKGLQRRRRAEHYVFDGMDPVKAIAQAEKDYP
jgi:lysozyme